ncbi:site-specific DNA-methyltransferase [Streptomyces sp. NPDC055287]
MRTSGRLSLSWINKDRFLIGAQDGGYEWVDRDDFRVSETRLLRDVATVGEVHDDVQRAEDNLLITGDSGDVLRSLTRLPEFAEKYRGKVKLAYIDPPFNTGEAFVNYDDGLEHSVWLGLMRDRLTMLRDLLADDGSLWVHLDDAEMAYCRVLLDEIFGRNSFVATVVWQKRTTRDNRAAFSATQDYIFVYSPAGPSQWKNVRNRLADPGEFSNPDKDPRGPWRSVPMSAQAGHATANQFYDITTPTGVVHSPPPGRAWTYSRERFEGLREQNMIYWPKKGDGKPRLKRFPSEDDGLVPFTLWLASEVGSNPEGKRESARLFGDGDVFDTPKPERLLQQIIHVASDPGDIVLDCFGGSGTTAAVAHKMGRRWVTAEQKSRTVGNFLRPRLEKVVNGEDPGGVTVSVGWEKGGGFRQLEVAPSMYERLGGRVLLAPWVDGHAFAEAACAQIPGFELDPAAETPFVGYKGRQRLAVVDGLVSESTVRSIVEALSESESVLIVAKSYLREAASLLEKLSPGSRIKKAPQDLLDMKGRVLR